MSASTRALAAKVGRRLSTLGLTLVTAESCTGGWVAKAVTDIPGSSRWFLGGYVVYSNAAKQQMLGVRAGSLERFGAVSEVVAREMARGALKAASGDIAVAITGIAGPGGGSAAKPVGLVWICWARRNGRRVDAVVTRRLFRGSRTDIRVKAVTASLRGLLRP